MDGLTSTPAQRWLARLSFVLAGLVIVILMVFAGLKSLAAVVVSLAAAYFFLSRRGIWHWLSLADWHMPEHPAQPPARHPYLIMNPKSGGGKIEAPQALLVSNNPYGTGARLRHLAGISERAPRSPH